MATAKVKVSQKLSNKDDFMSVDHKAFKSAVWEYVGWYKKSNWFFLGSLQHVLCMGLIINFNFQDMEHLEDGVQYNAVHGIKESKQTCVYIDLLDYFFCMCTPTRMYSSFSHVNKKLKTIL